MPMVSLSGRKLVCVWVCSCSLSVCIVSVCECMYVCVHGCALACDIVVEPLCITPSLDGTGTALLRSVQRGSFLGLYEGILDEPV